MKTTKIIINALIYLGILLSTYFLYLSLTPEGYTGRMLWFTYDVHSPRNPAIVIAVLVVLLVAINFRSIFRVRRKLRLVGTLALALAILVAVLFFLSYKRHNRPPWKRPNVVIIVVDTLRADHVGEYGANYAQTANIDRLAREGWLFEEAYTHIPITMPSHSALFSGRLPHDVGVYKNGDTFRYAEPTLAEIFREQGYRTGAVISLGILRSRFGLDRGFEQYDDRLPGNGQWFNCAEVVTDRGIDWLRENVGDGDRFFLWLHYSDPHEPYSPPDYPPDTVVELNGEEVDSGRLDSAAYINIPLRLNPGENVVTIRRLADSSIRLYLTYLHFSGVEDGPFPEEWERELRRSRRSGSYRARDLRQLQRNQFMRNFDGLSFAGLTFHEGNGWQPPDPGLERPRRQIEGGCTMTITNEGDEAREVTLQLKGGVNKRIGIVWEDYAREVEYADREIGRFLSYLDRRGLTDNTIIVLLADHGEELNEHGHVGHIHYLYRQSLQVPLIIRDPDSDRRGVRVRRTARIIDVAPTVLDMAGLHKPTYMEGRTLLEYILRNRSDERSLLAETFEPEADENKVALLRGDSLLIYTPGAETVRQLELYNFRDDEIQWRNTALSSTAGGLNQLAREARGFWEAMQAEGTEAEADAESREMLADLGYLHSASLPSLVSDLGVPGPALLERVRQALASCRTPHSELGVDTQRAGDGSHYIFVRMTLPPETSTRTVMSLQDYVKVLVTPQARQFPLRLQLTADDEIFFDQVYAGNPGNIYLLYSLRLLRLLIQQPSAATLSPAFEILFPQASEILERNVGLLENGK